MYGVGGSVCPGGRACFSVLARLCSVRHFLALLACPALVLPSPTFVHMMLFCVVGGGMCSLCVPSFLFLETGDAHFVAFPPPLLWLHRFCCGTHWAPLAKPSLVRSLSSRKHLLSRASDCAPPPVWGEWPCAPPSFLGGGHLHGTLGGGVVPPPSCFPRVTLPVIVPPRVAVFTLSWACGRAWGVWRTCLSGPCRPVPAPRRLIPLLGSLRPP